MPSESTTPHADQANLMISPAVPIRPADARTRAAEKGAATFRRHRDELRADRLGDIRSQIAEGTLVVRQMTAAQHRAAALAAGRVRTRNEARIKLSRAR